MRMVRKTRWATWSPVSSGFRKIELRGDRLESVGHLAPFLAPADLLGLMLLPYEDAIRPIDADRSDTSVEGLPRWPPVSQPKSPTGPAGMSYPREKRDARRLCAAIKDRAASRSSFGVAALTGHRSVAPVHDVLALRAPGQMPRPGDRLLLGRIPLALLGAVELDYPAPIVCLHNLDQRAITRCSAVLAALLARRTRHSPLFPARFPLLGHSGRSPRDSVIKRLELDSS